MNEIITERKVEFETDRESTGKRGDLLTNLIAAAADDEEEAVPQNEAGGKRHLALSESDLRGFVLLPKRDAAE
jgi:hypothetical protein